MTALFLENDAFLQNSEAMTLQTFLQNSEGMILPVQQILVVGQIRFIKSNKKNNTAYSATD